MSAHLKRADDLKDEDRILLKDLRILTVTGRPQPGIGMVAIKYVELATKTHAELVVAMNQQVKVLCDWGCPICLELDELL